MFEIYLFKCKFCNALNAFDRWFFTMFTCKKCGKQNIAPYLDPDLKTDKDAIKQAKIEFFTREINRIKNKIQILEQIKIAKLKKEIDDLEGLKRSI